MRDELIFHVLFEQRTHRGLAPDDAAIDTRAHAAAAKPIDQRQPLEPQQRRIHVARRDMEVARDLVRRVAAENGHEQEGEKDIGRKRPLLRQSKLLGESVGRLFRLAGKLGQSQPAQRCQPVKLVERQPLAGQPALGRRLADGELRGQPPRGPAFPAKMLPEGAKHGRTVPVGSHFNLERIIIRHCTQAAIPVFPLSGVTLRKQNPRRENDNG